MKKLTIISIMVLAFLTLTKNASGQTHYFYPTIVNSSNCNVNVSFLDGGFNVIYSNTFAPGTTLVGCVTGACAWVTYSAVGTCERTIVCGPSVIDNSYISSCGNCCSAPCLPFNTAEIPAANYFTTSYPTGICVSAPLDVEDRFTLLLY